MLRRLPQFVLALVIFSLSPISGLAASGDVIRAPVNDYAGVIPDPIERHVGEKLRAHYRKTGVQMAVVVIETTGGEPIEDFSLRVAEQWGGGNAGEDRGVLLTLAIDDRRSRLEVGYGLEGLLPDGWAANLLADMRPELRANDYQGAVRRAVNRVMARTQAVRPGETPGRLASNPLWNTTVGGWIILLIGWLISMGMILLARRDVEPFSGDEGIWWGLGAHAILAAMIVAGTFAIAPRGYFLVYCVGAICGTIVIHVQSWKRFAPVVGVVVVLLLSIRYPEIVAFGYQEPDWQLASFGGWLLVSSLFPWLRYRFLGRTYGSSSGSSYSGSSYSGGGYSGGGGSFGGGGASGGW